MGNVEVSEIVPPPIIYLVDDESNFQILGGLQITRVGYTGVVFDRAEDLLNRFLQEPSICDGVVTDFHMDGMDGLGLARLLRIRAGDLLPIIMMTSDNLRPLRENLQLGLLNVLLPKSDYSALRITLVSEPIRELINKRRKFFNR